MLKWGKEITLSKKGYTLLEVTLFLALSSMLALIAFAGLSPRLRNASFTDSVRGLESSIQNSLSDSEKGKSLRQSGKTCTGTQAGVTLTNGTQNSGASGSCIVIGRAAHFEKSVVSYRDVIALRQPLGCVEGEYDQSVEKLIKCYKPQIADASSKYTYANGLVLNYANPAATTRFSLVSLRDPETSRLIIGKVERSGQFATFPWGGISFTDSNSHKWVGSYTTPLCFSVGSRSARFTFTEKSVNPKVEFDVEGECA